MKLKFDFKMKFDNVFKYFIYGLLYLLVFYILIVKNIISIYETKDYIESAESRNERLLEEKNTFLDKKSALESRVKAMEEGKSSDKNIKSGKYFYNTGEIISLIDELVAKYDGEIVSIKNIERDGNIVRIPTEISIEEENLMPFLYELENDDYGIFLLDKNLNLTIKKGNRVNLNAKLAVALSRREKIKENQQDEIDKEILEENADRKIFSLDTGSKSFIRIGSNIIYSKKSISKSEEQLLKETLENTKKKKKKAVKKLNEVQKSPVNEDRIKN